MPFRPSLKLFKCLQILCFLSLCLCWQKPAWAEAGYVILKVLVNTQDAGSHFMTLKEDGDVWIKRDTLLAVGLTHIPHEKTDDAKFLSLRSLAPLITYELHTATGELALQADASLLPKTYHRVENNRVSNAVLIQDDAVYLNYSLDYQKSNQRDAIISAPLELGINVEGISINNLVQYQQHQPVKRTQSQIVYDNTAILQRWVFGDIQASSGTGIGGAKLGGIHVSKNFGLQPNVLTTPSLDLQVILLTPSEVEVWVDGQLLYTEYFPAGELNLSNLRYYHVGTGKAVVVVRDAFGREQRYDYSYYGASHMLASGLHSYNYSLGIEQITDVKGQLDYQNKPLFYGFHSYGFTNGFTSGLGLETDGRNTRAGWVNNIVLGNYGQLDLTVAMSRRQGLLQEQIGKLFQFNYNYTDAGTLSPNVFYNRQTNNYGGILDTVETKKGDQWEGGVGLSTSLGQTTSISTRWSRKLSLNQEQSEQATASINTRLSKNISLTTQFSRNWVAQRQATDQMNILLGRYFSNGIYLSANYSRDNQTNTYGIQIQFSPPLGEGYGYNAGATKNDTTDPNYTSRMSYRNQYAEVSVSALGNATAQTYDAKLSSALVLVDGGLYVSRPVRNSFALVRVHGMQGIDVRVQHQDIGKTNSDGEILVPYVYAYSDNRIEISPALIPLGYKIDSTSKNITTSYHGGGLVDFHVVPMQTIEGKIFYSNQGKLKPAQYSILEVEVDGETRSTVIGDAGALYLENISAGVYSAKVYNKRNNCSFQLVIPKSKQLMNEIDDVVCELHNK